MVRISAGDGRLSCHNDFNVYLMSSSQRIFPIIRNTCYHFCCNSISIISLKDKQYQVWMHRHTIISRPYFIETVCFVCHFKLFLFEWPVSIRRGQVIMCVKVRRILLGSVCPCSNDYILIKPIS